MIKRNSLHFRLYEKYSTGEAWEIENGRVNFCKYSRKVTLGVLNAMLITCAITLALLGPLQGLGTVLLWSITDNGWVPFVGALWPGQNDLAIGWVEHVGYFSWILLYIEIMIGGLVAIIAGGFYLHLVITESGIISNIKDSEPGFVRTWYRSWKDEYCPIVELEDR